MEKVREEWIAFLRRIADPVLDALVNGELKRTMPVEAKEPERKVCTHMEAFGRLLTGIAPWVELPAGNSAEGRLRAEYAENGLKIYGGELAGGGVVDGAGDHRIAMSAAIAASASL